MKKLRITALGLSAIKISDGNTNIYVDAFFSDHAISSFDDSDAKIIIVTHDHGDHFSVADTAQAARKTGAVIIGPPSIAYPLLVKESVPGEKLRILYHQDPNTPSEVQIGEVSIRSYASRHFFDADNMTIHNSYLLEMAGKRIFITGDSNTIAEKEERLKDLDALIYNFVTSDNDLSKVSELEDVLRKFSPRLLLPVHMIDCSWTIEPEELRHEIALRNIEAIKVLPQSGSYIEI